MVSKEKFTMYQRYKVETLKKSDWNNSHKVLHIIFPLSNLPFLVAVEEAEVAHLILAVEVAADKGELRFLVVEVVAEEYIEVVILILQIQLKDNTFMTNV